MPVSKKNEAEFSGLAEGTPNIVTPNFEVAALNFSIPSTASPDPVRPGIPGVTNTSVNAWPIAGSAGQDTSNATHALLADFSGTSEGCGLPCELINEIQKRLDTLHASVFQADTEEGVCSNINPADGPLLTSAGNSLPRAPTGPQGNTLGSAVCRIPAVYLTEDEAAACHSLLWDISAWLEREGGVANEESKKHAEGKTPQIQLASRVRAHSGSETPCDASLGSSCASSHEIEKGVKELKRKKSELAGIAWKKFASFAEDSGLTEENLNYLSIDTIKELASSFVSSESETGALTNDEIDLVEYYWVKLRDKGALKR